MEGADVEGADVEEADVDRNNYSYGLRLAGKQLAYGKRSGKKVIKKPCGKR